MTTPREQLLGILKDHEDGPDWLEMCECGESTHKTSHANHLVDVILAAGWQPPSQSS